MHDNRAAHSIRTGWDSEMRRKEPSAGTSRICPREGELAGAPVSGRGLSGHHVAEFEQGVAELQLLIERDGEMFVAN
ncbi:hypothetical protein MHEI_08080 [Mycobacterium heidelbergense]|nr:hypothetical protein MHEI_08080 [Mycobacterium heidelbergense]